VVRFFRIVFIQAKFQISLSLSNIRMTTRTFKFIHHIASFQMCLLVLVLKMISNPMCFMNERQMSKFFQICSNKVSAIRFLSKVFKHTTFEYEFFTVKFFKENTLGMVLRKHCLQ